MTVSVSTTNNLLCPSVCERPWVLYLISHDMTLSFTKPCPVGLHEVRPFPNKLGWKQVMSTRHDFLGWIQVHGLWCLSGGRIWESTEFTYSHWGQRPVLTPFYIKYPQNISGAPVMCPPFCLSLKTWWWRHGPALGSFGFSDFFFNWNWENMKQILNPKIHDPQPHPFFRDS